ncbi:MAG: mannitol dehydrogenase family protein [Hyphomicrobiales bacterium]|nr:mannitol dehydrogenase family protein [Hyphomicrobiales bacterium]MDE2017225.1 mannitol dehydrogenase family protein [Hyphomicrobiales bacterium]
MSTRLSLAALPSLGGGVSVPRYRRADLKPGILHIGLGNFHRAHQAVYLDELFDTGRGRDWALVGAGVRANDEDMRQKLMAQDWLTTVVAQEADATAARVTGAMVDFVKPGDPAAMLAALARPEIRIVSLTVTEGGYYIDPATQKFDAAHPDIVADSRNPDAPRTAFGLILAGLARRRAAGMVPFTVMCCDNIPGNGHVTRNAVAGLADLVDKDLAKWVREAVAFPDSMVDRITPATSDRERAIVKDRYGYEDSWPVFCEDFKQWVLEDNFPAGRPPLEEVGVTFTDAVGPYENMKIRVLNGGHAAIAYPGGLLDIHFVHEAMEDAQIRAFLAKLTKDEIMPTFEPPPGASKEDYRLLIERRFSNPKIGDTISRLALDGSNRQPKFILPPVRDRLAAGGGAAGLALVSAMWCRYCYGQSESGKAIPPNDPSWDRLQATAKAARADAKAWLAMKDIFGDLADHPVYVAAFSDALGKLWSQGVRKTLDDYLAGRA